MKRYILRMINIGVIVMVVSIAIFLFAFFLKIIILGGEDICGWYPEIDTVFADGFSKQKFNQVNVGEHESEALKILGSPLWKESRGNGCVIWGYSRDGALGWWGDKAWFSYELSVSNHVVIVKEINTYYD